MAAKPPIRAIVVAYEAESERVAGQIILRRDQTLTCLGDVSVCTDVLALLVRAVAERMPDPHE